MIAAGWSLILLPIAILCTAAAVALVLTVPGIGTIALVLAGSLTAKIVKARRDARRDA